MAIKVIAPTIFDINQGNTGTHELHFNTAHEIKGDWNEFWFFDGEERTEIPSFTLWFSGKGWGTAYPNQTLIHKIDNTGTITEIDQGVTADHFWTSNVETASSDDGQYIVTINHTSTDDALSNWSAEVLYSQDYGVTWNRVTDAPLGPVLREEQYIWYNKHVIWTGSEFYLMIENGIVNPGQGTGEIYTSPNGKDWILKGTLSDSTPIVAAGSKLEYANGTYYLTSDSTSYIGFYNYNTGFWYSTDGINYSPLYDRNFEYDDYLYSPSWAVYDVVNDKVALFPVDGWEDIWWHDQAGNRLDKGPRMVDLFSGFGKPFYWKGKIWVYGQEAGYGRTGWWYTEDTGATWSYLVGSADNFGFPYNNTATNFHGWDHIIIGDKILFHFDNKIWISSDMQTWEVHATLPSGYNYEDYLGMRPVGGPKKNLVLSGCEGCVVSWLTEEILYNDYLPEGVTEHTDDNPEVAMMGYQYYKQLEYTVDGTTPTGFSIVTGALPPGLSLNSSTLEITGVPSVGCYTDDGNIPFNQWILNENEWRESDPRWYEFGVVADCDETPITYKIPVYPDWTPYKNSLSSSVQHFERDVIIKEYEEYVDARTIVRTGLCTPCDGDVVENKKTRLNTIRTDAKYQHNDMRDKFMTESTCDPYELTKKSEPEVEIQEEITLYRREQKIQQIDRSGLCTPCEDDDASST